MLAITRTMALTGLEAIPVQVEVDIQTGLPGFEIVGLASLAVKEARERVRSAIRNSGFLFPNRKITVNLAPADIKKEGSHFDLAMAAGILIASGQVSGTLPDNLYLVGELSLNGGIRGVPGVLAMALELGNGPGKNELVVPIGNGAEAALVEEIESRQISCLAEIAAYIDGQAPLPSVAYAETRRSDADDMDRYLDFAEVKGQETAKRALQVAAAGLHNLLMIGPPGGGKTMLARRLPGIMPPMNRQEMLETTRIYSVAGLLSGCQPLIIERPFRAPHKNASSASIIGGGRIPRPGEISLAQNGVLFLDEMPEFNRDVLESLRQPLEDKQVTIARSHATYTYPADFALIASMNPCACGNFGSDTECTCTPPQIQRYLSRISGPLLDRMDLQVEVVRIQIEQLQSPGQGKTSALLRAEVEQARNIQYQRFAGSAYSLNSQMSPAAVAKYCALDQQTQELLALVFRKFQMSGRAYDRILKVARTIADLDASAMIKLPHLAEAIQYRSLDHKYWHSF